MQVYPAIKARIGDWDYYIVRMTMREVAREVQLASDLWEDKTLSEAIQRVVDESRVKQQIVNFLTRRDDRFFSSLVVAAIGGNPSFSPIETRFTDTFGELTFQVDPRYFALDGQHRLRAIQEVMADPAGAPSGFADEQLSVIVVVREHQAVDDSLWLQRYRRLFSSLNRYAKPTDSDTNIIMDEDDVVAIVTRRLITDHEFFRAPDREKQSFRVQTKGKNVRSGASHFTSLQTLYEINKTMLMTAERRRKWGRPRELKAFLQFRPEESDIDLYYAEVAKCWEALLDAVPVLRERPEVMRVHELPTANEEGYRDHLLFWPIGQEVLAEVVRALLDAAHVGTEAEVQEMVKTLAPLASVPWVLHDPPWRFLLLVPPEEGDKSWRIRNEERKRALEVAGRLVRWLVQLDPLDDASVRELRKDWRALLYPEPSEEGEVEAMWKAVVGARAGILTETPEQF